MFAEIEVPMTDFKVDVLYGGTKQEYELFQQKRYGLDKDDTSGSNDNETFTAYTDANSELKGIKRFCFKLATHPLKNIPFFIHELWHLMWHIGETIKDFKITHETQGWSACMIETLSYRIINAKYVKV